MVFILNVNRIGNGLGYNGIHQQKVEIPRKVPKRTRSKEKKGRVK